MRGTEARRHRGTAKLVANGLCRVVVFLCLGASVPRCLASQQRPAPAQNRAARNCVIHLDSTKGNTQFFQQADGTQNVFIGGGVWASCVNEPTHINSDSLQYFQGSGLVQFINRVHFVDSASTLDADKVSYWLRQERLYAEGNVVSRTSTGSEMRGPNLDYYRAVAGVRDTLQIIGTGRPTIRFIPASDSAKGDTTNPFIIIADRALMRHTDRMWGSGHVVIDRTDLHATADSAQLDLADSIGLLIGQPEVIGRDTSARARSDTLPRDSAATLYTLRGQRIRFDLGEHQQVRRVLSSGDAHARGPDWQLLADTLDMALDSSKIQRTQAWGDNSRPVAVSGLSRIVADSLDIQMPGQQMKQVWAYGHARANSKSDSTVTEDDWLSGDSLRAEFAQLDSAGHKRSEIQKVIAFGTARAYYHTDNEKDPHAERGINYSRGERILIAMSERKVKTVDIVGEVDGLYLEPMPPLPDSLKPDSLRMRPDSLRPDSLPRDTVRADSGAARPPAVAPAPEGQPQPRPAPTNPARPPRETPVTPRPAVGTRGRS